MNTYIKPSTIVIKMEETPLLASLSWQVSDGKTKIDGGSTTKTNGSEADKNPNTFAKQYTNPFDDAADNNMNW